MASQVSATSSEGREFGSRSTALEVIAGHDLQGCEAIVTGGAAGIGVETVRALATAGARVVSATRNVAQANDVATANREHAARSRVARVGAIIRGVVRGVRAARTSAHQ